MREDAASPMTAQSRTAIAPDTGALRLGGGVPPGAESSSAPLVTAEIPAVPASSDYGVLLPDGSIWYPGSRRRLPAPLLLRLVVWILAFATLVVAAGDFVIHFHPNWVNPLRNVATTTSPSVATGGRRPAVASTSGTSGPATRTSGQVSLIAPQPPGLPPQTSAYSVGADPYAVEVTASHLTWVGVWSLVNGQVSAFRAQQTLQPGQTGTFIENGPVEVKVGASLTVVKIFAGGHEIGLLNQPTPWSFYLEPATAG